MAAILLHDVVEDTGMKLEELPFPDEVQRLVQLVTFRECPGKSKEEAKADYYERIR